MGSEWLHTLDGEGRTPLDRAYKGGHPAVAELMMRQEKADQALALSSESPLHRAAYLGLASAVKSLITYGATDEAVDGYGETPLHKAVRQGHLSTVEVLVRTSDVNAVSNEGMSPLHWAVLTGREDIVQLLTLHGADDPGVTAEHVAAFQEEMRKGDVDWYFVAYGDAVHSFTQKKAGTDKSKGNAYNEKADKRSWEHMKSFFREIFGELE